MQSTPFPRYLVPLGPNILLNTMFSNTLSFFSSRIVNDDRTNRKNYVPQIFKKGNLTSLSTVGTKVTKRANFASFFKIFLQTELRADSVLTLSVLIFCCFIFSLMYPVTSLFEFVVILKEVISSSGVLQCKYRNMFNRKSYFPATSRWMNAILQNDLHVFP